ncbi:Gag-Pol polyprotein [Labeo rohita]|uniref:Gypsy retrotransposon integrase-like protein 1 n=1 Tax=Labeo rohita TaxID=84645 RepID=A0ABQ8MQY8_LABRO|nr:Gag-Pol polyprotein [Labeo rohita]
MQLVLPEKYWTQVLLSLHDDSGHLRVERPAKLLKDRFYWPRMSKHPDSRGFGNVLVVTDHFTHYAQAFTCKDQKALTVAKTLCDKFFIHYGLPSRIHLEQGRDFESGLIKELLKIRI